MVQSLVTIYNSDGFILTLHRQSDFDNINMIHNKTSKLCRISTGRKLHSGNCIVTILLAVMLPVTYSCSGNKEEETIKDCATAFANAYFNHKYNAALRNATVESKKWIRYVAGNLTQEDLDKINSCDDTANCVMTGMQQETDTTALATFEVTNAFLPDTIGKAGRMIDKGNVNLALKKRNGQWTVHLNSVPQILATNK